MSVTLPNPNSPTNGDDIDADPVRANFQALLAAINAFDGANINSKTILEGPLADAVNPRLRDGKWMQNWIVTGLNPGGSSGFLFTLPGGTVFINGILLSVIGQTFTVNPSKDTYYSVTSSGALGAAQEVANNASSPTLAVNSMWAVKIVSDGAGITKIVLNGFDSVGNLIHNTLPFISQLQNQVCHFQAYPTAAFNFGNNVFAKVGLDTIDFDKGGNFDTTNNQFVAPVAGHYHFSGRASTSTSASGNGYGVALFINGSYAKQGDSFVGSYTGSFIQSVGIDCDVDLLKGDTVILTAYGTGNAGDTGSQSTYLSGFLVGV